jgi:hypothetical protein
MTQAHGGFRFRKAAALAVAAMMIAAVHVGCSGKPIDPTTAPHDMPGSPDSTTLPAGPVSSGSTTLPGGPAVTESVPEAPAVTETVAAATEPKEAVAVARQPTAKGPRPLRVIILAGQSNMQKPAKWTTLKGLADSPETKPLYDKLVDEKGRVRIHKDVYETLFETKRISRWKSEPLPPRGGALPAKFGGKVLGVDEEGGDFGPELGFGVTLYEKLQEPILIIKTAWGGKSLYGNFRPPIGEDWIPPRDHPDHPDNVPAAIPIPSMLEVPADFEPPAGRGKNIQLGVGLPIGEVSGVHPIYVVDQRSKSKIEPNPLQKGDLIIGLNGRGLGGDPVGQWRKTWFTDIRNGDWMLKITLWRDGKIMTFDVDTAEELEGGRAGIPAFIAERDAAAAARKKKLREEGGEHYGMMLARIKEVLADPGKFHPAYDPEQGYEIAGFVWFHGFNDVIAGGVYPNRTHPRGYEQYSWLLAHLIRHVRKELNAPKMPVVIGVFGQGGKLDKPHPFREAQAAVADYDEFKGNVTAVRTAPFYDERIPEMQGRLDRVMAYDGGDPNHPYAKLQKKIRAFKAEMGDPEKLPRKERGKVLAKIRTGIIEIVQTPEEREYLRNNVSNAGYHYYGSPKFFVRAGVAFAEALGDMIER